MYFSCSVSHVFRILAASSVIVTVTYLTLLFCRVSLSLSLLCLAELMFVSEEILSAVNTCGLTALFLISSLKSEAAELSGVFTVCVCECVCVHT